MIKKFKEMMISQFGITDMELIVDKGIFIFQKTYASDIIKINQNGIMQSYSNCG